jgi:CDP-glucose 4,6-dehydratase
MMATDDSIVGEAFNFSNEIQLNVLDLTKKILLLMGREELSPTVLDQASNEIHHQYLSAEKARSMLGWQPDFSLEDGLGRTIAWYEKFLETS